MIYTCKKCKSIFNNKTELLKCIKCGKSICTECGIKCFSNIYYDDSYYICNDCFNTKERR